MAANSKQPKRESRAQRRQEEQARVQAKRERLQKERRTQTIIGIVVTVVLIALIAIAGIAVYRNTHPSAARQQEAANEQSAAQATLKDSKVKPAKASELGGLLMSKNGYNKPVEGVPTARAIFDGSTDKKDADFMEERRLRLAQTKDDTTAAILNALAESRLGSMASSELRAAVTKEVGCSEKTYNRAYAELVKSGRIRKKAIRERDGCNRWYSFSDWSKSDDQLKK